MTNNMNDMLFQMHPSKALGPDGMNASFLQNLWNVLEIISHRLLFSFFTTGHMPKSINDTFIELIPKTKEPVKMTESRPISLCNAVYKLISKVLANRLKKILPSIITKSQSPFVSGRLISYNVLDSFGLLNSMN